MVLCVNRLYPPVLAPRTSQSLWVRNPTTGMLFWSDLQKPIFYILQTMATGTYHTLLERSGWGDCSAVGIVGNGSVLVEKFHKQVWQYGFWEGNWFWKSIRASRWSELRRTATWDVAIDSVKRGTDHSFGNQCRESKKAGSILGSLLFPSYLFFHTSDSGQIWDPRKAVFKENLTLLRARRLEKNSWRTLEVTGTNQLT